MKMKHVLVSVGIVAMSCGSGDQGGNSRSYGAKGSDASLQSKDVVEFHIPAGTGDQSWNSAATEVAVTIGQTLRIINDDTIGHRLHTNGKPCPHGPQMAAAGGAYNCVISVPYNRATDGDLYEHNVGPNAKFYLRVSAAPTPTPTPTSTPTAEPTLVPTVLP